MKESDELFSYRIDPPEEVQPGQVVEAPKSVVDRVRMKLRIRTRLRTIKRRLRVRTRLRDAGNSVKKAIERRKYNSYDGAILTLSGYYNYGNVLQRYALQKFLDNNGRSFVSYWNEQPIGRTDTKKQTKNIRNFVKQNIKIKSFDEKDNFKNYIVGSDQVWRNWTYRDVKRDLGYYFFNFLGGRQANLISYAASVGQDTLAEALIDEDTSRYLEPYAKKIQHLSVRESSAIELLNKEWGVKARRVIDPTLLLDAKEYESLFSNFNLKDGVDSESVFTYFILSDGPRRTFVEKILKEQHLKERSIYLERGGVLPAVELWLKGIHDAKLVIADSFHGIVFSIIFNRPFLVLESGTGGEARIVSLLSDLGLLDRYVRLKDMDSFSSGKLYDIDWKKVNKNLAKLKRDSGEWLLKSITNA